MLANTRWSSSQTAVVPLGERFGVPSGQTVATKPRRCSSTTRFMSAVRKKAHDSVLLSCRLSKGLYKTKNTEPGLVTMGFELCTQCTFRKESSLDRKLQRLIKRQA